jgi:bis(5'-nucleosyl)-tetraphosphatase (symmetrical)
MAHYIVGDVQGCYQELETLLKKVKFNKETDQLIFAGDLVNRGKDSYKVLEFCINNKKSVYGVLGNHDFYLLYLIEHQKKDKSLKKVLESKNLQQYQSWLKALPLFLEIKIKETNEVFWISHAGIPFIWSINDAKRLSEEVQVSLKNDASNILAKMWGDTPKRWNENLKGYKRLRVIINYFTRMRYLSEDGSLKLDLKSKTAQKGYIHWFNQTKENLNNNENIVFGHWASINGETNIDNIIGLDTGCVWGNKLTAIRLEDKKIFQIKKQ